MKTCEQYVLAKLTEAEKKVQEQEAFIEIFTKAAINVFEDLQFLLKHIEIKTSSDGGRYATMDYVLEKFDEKDFKKILTMLDAVNYAEEMAQLEENKGAD